MRRIILIMVLLIGASMAGWVLGGQEEDDEGGLVVEASEITAGNDAFGQVVRYLDGVLTNTSRDAFENITLFADMLDADGNVIGEGFGGLVNECEQGLLPSFALQPGSSQQFRLQVELFEDGDIDRFEIFPEGTPVDPEPLELSPTFIGITAVTEDEVVNVEWIDPITLRYAVGCDADIFINQTWYRYELGAEAPVRIVHPNTQDVTDALLQVTGLTEPEILNRSYLTFSPTSNRWIYQGDLNAVLTAEIDGSFRRLIYDGLGRLSLHGYIWLPEGRFLAYYYGAYGDPVTYYTASVQGQLISRDAFNAVPSQTIPGPTPDGARVVITTTVDDVTGYYLQEAIFQGTELLFEAEPPGNNWPAPIYYTDPNGQAYIYIVRPASTPGADDEQIPVLQCFDMQTRTLNDLTVLPLDITTDERAWTWLSPDANTIALAANGVNGGLWLIDIPTFGRCGAPLQG